MIQPDIKKAFDEGDVKRLAIIRDDNFILLDVLNEIIQVFPIDISFNLMTVIKRYGCYFVKLAVQACCFNVQISCGIPELGKESPGLICRQAL